MYIENDNQPTLNLRLNIIYVIRIYFNWTHHASSGESFNMPISVVQLILYENVLKSLSIQHQYVDHIAFDCIEP